MSDPLATSPAASGRQPAGLQAQARRNELALPSLSARHIHRHEPSGIELMRAAIELSPQGFRVRHSLQGERHREMLQDFVANEAWLIDHRRSIAHRLPLEDDETDIGMRPGDASSFLGQEPCGALFEQEDAGTGRWKGREVQAWHCKDAKGEIINIEFVDEVYGIVVYQRSADGQINELKNLQDRTFPSGHFRPDERLRSVSRQEFFGGAPDIPPYKEVD